MPCFDVVKEVKPEKTFRVSNIVSNFDLDVEHIHEHFTGNIDIDGREWNVGLIVGGSGTGKTTIARECFPDAYATSIYKYTAAAVVDDMREGSQLKRSKKHLQVLALQARRRG